MDIGASWSGHERNNGFINLTDGSFVDASGVLGIDFEDDGRAVVSADWDGDGDLDLWLRNRTGPQLRLMRNDAAEGRSWLSLELVGTRCNRDAVGARVKIQSGWDELIRTVRCGDGYLARSSKRLHFGLGDAKNINGLEVTWPGGETQSFRALSVNGRYRIVQGEDAPVRITTEPSSLPSGALPDPGDLGSVAIPLRTPLPLPPSLKQRLWSDGEPRGWTAVNLWSRTCPPCAAELAEWSDHKADLKDASLEVSGLGMDGEDPAAAAWFKEACAGSFASVAADDAARDMVEALVLNVRRLQAELPLPTTMLVDHKGNLQSLYVGKTTARELIEGRARMAQSPPHRRSMRGGRWFFAMPRDWSALAKELERRGHDKDGAFYRRLR